jgi:hypothetical protein
MKKLLFFLSILFILMINTDKQYQALAFDENKNTKGSKIEFAVDSGTMYFFDTASNIVYSYTSRGQLRNAYKIEQFGEKMQSLSTFDIRERTQNQ